MSGVLQCIWHSIDVVGKVVTLLAHLLRWVPRRVKCSKISEAILVCRLDAIRLPS